MQKKKLFRILLILGISIIVLILISVVYIFYRQNNNPLSVLFKGKQELAISANIDESSKKALDNERKKLNPALSALSSSMPTQTVGPTPTNQKNYTDILVMGVDSRELQLESQTDSIILVRVDNDNKKIMFISFSRDIYLNIPGFTENRLNEACVYGGPELVMKTINQAFDLNIKNYIVFDFKTAEKMIDLIGDVNVDIDKNELSEINSYISELNNISSDDKKAGLLQHTGMQKLNGRQAVAYARLRPNKGSDFKRMERQKEIVNSLMQSVKKLKTDQILPLINNAFDTFYSNLSIAKISAIAMDTYKIKDQVEQQYLTIPTESSYKEVTLIEMRYIVIDLMKNEEAINKFLLN